FSGLTSSAQVATGTGTLTISNSGASGTILTVNAQTNTFGNVNPVTVSGNLALTVPGGASVTKTITTNDTIADVDLLITAKITDGDGNANLQNVATAGTRRLELAPTSAGGFSGTFTRRARPPPAPHAPAL